jgi:hypothetical protein
MKHVNLLKELNAPLLRELMRGLRWNLCGLLRALVGFLRIDVSTSMLRCVFTFREMPPALVTNSQPTHSGGEKFRSHF